MKSWLKKQRARKDVVLVRILDVLLAERKSPSPPLLDCPIPSPHPQIFEVKQRKLKKYKSKCELIKQQQT